MVVAGIVAVIVVDVTKVLVRDAAIMNMAAVVEVLFIVLLTGMEIVVVGVIRVDLKSAVSVSYSVDMPSALAVDLSMVALAITMLGVLLGIGIAVLADVNANANAFVLVMTALDSPVPTPLEEFSRWAAFDCRPLALLD